MACGRNDRIPLTWLIALQGWQCLATPSWLAVRTYVFNQCRLTHHRIRENFWCWNILRLVHTPHETGVLRDNFSRGDETGMVCLLHTHHGLHSPNITCKMNLHAYQLLSHTNTKGWLHTVVFSGLSKPSSSWEFDGAVHAVVPQPFQSLRVS